MMKLREVKLDRNISVWFISVTVLCISFRVHTEASTSPHGFYCIFR